jgi:hypothetical protein
MVFTAFKAAHAPDADSLDVMLNIARQQPGLLEKMHKKYDSVREMFRAQELHALSELEIAQLIAQLRPTDLLN